MWWKTQEENHAEKVEETSSTSCPHETKEEKEEDYPSSHPYAHAVSYSF